MVSSHFSPGPAPHVGQRTACTCLRLGFLAFTVVYDAEIRSKKMFNLVQKTRIVVEKSLSRSKSPQCIMEERPVFEMRGCGRSTCSKATNKETGPFSSLRASPVGSLRHAAPFRDIVMKLGLPSTYGKPV